MIIKNKLRHLVFCIGLLAGLTHPAYSQEQSSADMMTLDQCIDYALKNKPAVNQALLNIKIAHATNAINLAGWLPQVNAGITATHYETLPTAFINNVDSTGGVPRRTTTGVGNTFIPNATVSQTIFNPQLLYAAHSAPLYIDQAREIKDSTDINVVWGVSKAYYNLLLTLKQINVLKEDTARLNRNVTDTYHQLIGGIVDETDHDEAIISLNNALIQLKQQDESIPAQYAMLKQAMGYPPGKQFNVIFDSTRMMSDINADTTEELQFEKRIEYKELETARQLQHAVTGYYNLAFLPTASVYYNYYYEYENDNTNGLFATAYPYSYFGLSLNIPIFTGFSRLNNIKKSRLQEQTLNFAMDALKSEIYTEYTSSLGAYKSNLYNFKVLKDNVDRAKNTYRIVSLQYKQGIVAYLNMIVAESNLISAEIGYTNALFQLMSSKMDLEKAKGNISPMNH